MSYKHIGPVLSKVQRDLRKIQAGKRPKKKKKESYDHYLGRVGVWLIGQEQKKKPPKPKKKLTEYQRRIKARKEAEKVVGLRRGIKKKRRK